ncbi:MAG: nuclear transport factor 2 family protein [Deltaproteobacteria bacterium]
MRDHRSLCSLTLTLTLTLSACVKQSTYDNALANNNLLKAQLADAQKVSPSTGSLAIAAPTPDAIAEILAFENEWMIAVQKRDAAALDRILTDDYLLLGSRGDTVTKRQYIDATVEGYVLERFSYEEPKVAIHGDTAIVCSGFTMTASFHGKTLPTSFLVHDVLIKEAGHWRVLGRHSSVPPSAK